MSEEPLLDADDHARNQRLLDSLRKAGVVTQPNLADAASVPPLTPQKIALGQAVEVARTLSLKDVPSSERATLAPAVSAAVAVGETGSPALAIPGYEVLEELGRGGMGVVYKARHAALQRVVALKMILAGGHAGADDLARFRREAEAIARLQHPGIVQIHEVGEHDGLPFFSLEFCSGGNLDKKLGGTPLPPREAAALVERLAQAVEVAHHKGVIHRDLKPANVLLAEDGTPKITDFGLAKKLDDVRHTASGAVMGTPSYMAPEQAGGRSKDIGPATDVYALGAILYECLTGRPPFRAATSLDTILQVVADEPVPPRLLQAKVSRDLETICLKCLEKQPGNRYGSAAGLAEDLRRFQAGEPIRARPAGRLERWVKWAQRRPALATAYGLLLTVVVLGVGGGGALWLWQRAEDARGLLAGALDQLGAEQALTEQALTRERQAKEAEAKAKEDLDQVLYLRRVSLALAAWKDNEVLRTEQVLQECPPARRQWEWYYVYRLCHADLRTLKGNTGMVLSVAFSPDGKRLASASSDQTVKVWDAHTDQEVLSLKGHTNLVSSVALSPDGKRLASASWDQKVKVWDLQTGQETLSLKGHTDEVSSVAFSPDGKRLASASSDQTVKVWDAQTGQEALALKGHTGPVGSVAFSPDGQRLASASTDGTAKVWDARLQEWDERLHAPGP